jgi:hypothetical protein
MDIMVYIATAVIALFIYVKFFKPKKGAGSFTIKSGQKFQTIDDKFNSKRKEKQDQIDRILEKISHEGIESLTPEEKAILDKNAK